ncbi:MAG: class I SAM-dependent methyltransferase [Christensenella sp.]|nr:class I SAM-dependent methyltransferase [Christensenella sp.]
MSEQWNMEAEQKHFAEIWEGRAPTRLEHTAKLWDERAHEWARALKGNETRKQRSENRVRATATFLRSRGLLAPDQSVIDIGCGPGCFVVEFARSAKSVLGVDLSNNMVEYGREAAREADTQQASFLACDFRSANFDVLGWRKQFDLAFLSITPAMQTVDDLDRVEAVSRAYCFHSSFVRAYDAVAQAALTEALPQIEHNSF